MYALREEQSGQLAACMQVNGYGLDYYGILLWEEAPRDAEIAEALTRLDGPSSAAVWKPVALTEHQAKMANVKLRNDVRRRVFLRDQQLVAESGDSE